MQYDRIARTELFAAEMERVVRGAGGFTIALMCAEKEPGEREKPQGDLIRAG